MDIAAQKGIRSIAFPCISTGVYRFPKQRAASIAVRTVRDALARGSSVKTVVFVCFSEEDYAIYLSLCPAPECP
jgi:O-acetyl-ADP-ribose deacetylase (regulator of RNase III)